MFTKSIFLLLLASNAFALTENLCGIPHKDKEFPFPERHLKVEDRIEIINQIYRRIKKKYVLSDLKKERIGVDADEVFSECIKEERTHTTGDPLRFHDRMKVCIAKFQDNHLAVEGVEDQPTIHLGFGVQKVGNKFIIRYRYEKVLKFAESTSDHFEGLSNKIKVGAEVLEVNGKPISEVVKKIKKYINASSDKARSMGAADAIFYRDFNYPVDRTVKVKIKVSEKSSPINLVLPWWFRKASNSQSFATQYLEKRGFCPEVLVTMDYNEKRGKFLPNKTGFEGFLHSMKLWRTLNEASYERDGRPVITMGIAIPKREKAFCYLQIKSFSNLQNLVRSGDSSGRKYTYEEVIKSYLMDCEERDLGLILDLRANGGGADQYVTQLIELLVLKGFTAPNLTVGMLNNTLSRRILERGEKTNGVAGYLDIHGEESVLVKKMIEDSKSSQSKYMKFLKLADYGSKLHKGVYTKPIVVLITPECISNCEVAAAVLKESKRAILVGSHTAGTGAGSYSYKNELEPKWTDQLHYTLKLRFPNQLFGIHPSSSQGELLDYEIAKEHTSENRPIVSTPSYEYETTLEDILHNGRGWKKMAIKALYPESRIEDLNPSLVP